MARLFCLSVIVRYLFVMLLRRVEKIQLKTNFGYFYLLKLVNALEIILSRSINKYNIIGYAPKIICVKKTKVVTSTRRR